MPAAGTAGHPPNAAREVQRCDGWAAPPATGLRPARRPSGPSRKGLNRAGGLPRSRVRRVPRTGSGAGCQGSQGGSCASLGAGCCARAVRSGTAPRRRSGRCPCRRGGDGPSSRRTGQRQFSHHPRAPPPPHGVVLRIMCAAAVDAIAGATRTRQTGPPAFPARHRAQSDGSSRGDFDRRASLIQAQALENAQADDDETETDSRRTGYRSNSGFILAKLENQHDAFDGHHQSDDDHELGDGFARPRAACAARGCAAPLPP